ncbi:GAF domain-containing protein [Halolamina salifodinae]|uniref:histidine kinase n=1 Tax=Halolamina salifodinae TaxID=1202767 RepID=A0A8T4GUM0_9EURY|nr:GAF domain-containing protein [Halolamina salifodinae]MBP1986100.1 PAS domain S-box-containing protein [Halolamina salifodinae]
MRAPALALAAFEESPPDCLVVCAASLPTSLAAAAADAGCPVVDCAGSTPPVRSAAAHGSGETDADADSLALRVRAAVDGTPNRDRIARLHEGSAELIGIEDRERLHQRVVEIGSEVLGFGNAVLYLYDGDSFRLGASTDPDAPETAEPGFGVLSEVRQTGEPAIIEDIDAHPVAEQRVEGLRSGIAIPFGDVGVLGALSPDVGSFDQADLEFGQLLANHGAQVDARIRAEESLRQRQARITRLHRAAPSLIDADSESALFARVVDIAEDVLALDQSVLFIARDGELTPVAGRIDQISAISTDAGILGRTYNENRSFLLDDARTNPDADPAGESIRSAISVPVGDAGVFQVISDETGTFDESDRELAELLVGYAEATLERIRSEAALRESRRLIERLHTTAMGLASAETEDELLDRAVDAAEDVLALDMCKIDLREDDMLVPVVESGGVPPEAGRPMHLSEGLAGKTARTGEPSLVDDLAANPDADPTNASFRSAISVPLGDLGVFQAVATEPAAFDQEDVDLAELLMAHTAVSLQRVRAEEDLRTERDSLDALFENIPGAAVAYEMIDGKPIVRRVNGAFEQTFGHDADSVIGESLDEFIIPSDGDENAVSYNERIANGERVQAEVERQTTTGPKHFLLQVTPLEVGEESAPGYAIYSDVTEQREREAELRRQNERLDQFASVVSHDLRNPLNVAAGYLELVRETSDEAHLDRVEDAIERMDDLVTDLLALAREGRDVGETESVGLEEMTHEAWSHVATGDASLRVESGRDIDADPERLIELFENLYRNSIEHAGETPTVTVGDLRRPAGFYVADDGPGIDPDIEPFDTGVTTSDEGTGFGLPIVQSIAEAHGWSVSATASEEGGARFEFVTD